MVLTVPAPAACRSSSLSEATRKKSSQTLDWLVLGFACLSWRNLVQELKHVPRRCRWLTLEAASNQLHPDTTAYLGGRDLIQYLFATAQASNITVIRTLAGSADDSDDFVLQTAPG